MNDATGIPLSPDPSIVSEGSRLQRYLLPLAVILAAAGQVTLLRIQPGSSSTGLMQLLGGVLLLLGAISFGISTAHLHLVDGWPAGWDKSMEHPAGADALWLPALMVSLAAAAASIGIFAVAGESPAVVALWLTAIILLFVAQIPGIHLSSLHLAGVRWEYALGIAGLLVVSVLTRSWHLTTLPLNFDGDFASVGLQSRAILTGQESRLFAFGWASIPIIGYLPSGAMMLLFGTGLLGLNASGVIQGTLVVLGVYLIGRELFHARVGLLAAAILVASYAHMALSRQAAYVDPVFTMTWAVYFLLIGLRTLRGWAIVLAGVLTALCLEVYYSGRIVLPLLCLALLYLLIFRRGWLQARWKALLLFVLAVVIALGPMLVEFVRSPDATMARSREVYIMDPQVQTHMKGVYHVDSAGAVLAQQAIRTALLFNYYPDKGTQFALLRPFLDPVTGVLFVLGFGYLLFGLRRPGSWLLLWWILLVLVVGCLLTVNAPFWPRLMVLLPPVALASALTINVLYGWLHGALANAGRVAMAVPIVTALVLGAVGVSNWNAYMRDKAGFATGRTRIARYLEAQPSTVRAYLISKGYTYQDREFQFLIPDRLVGGLTPEQAEQPITSAGAPTLLIVTPDEGDLVQRLAARYPGGPVGGNTPGEIAFYVFNLP